IRTSDREQISQKVDDADDDHDNADNLLGAPIERQQIDQIEDQDNDDERDQHVHQERHDPPRRRGLPGSPAGLALCCYSFMVFTTSEVGRVLVVGSFWSFYILSSYCCSVGTWPLAVMCTIL